MDRCFGSWIPRNSVLLMLTTVGVSLVYNPDSGLGDKGHCIALFMVVLWANVFCVHYSWNGN